MTLTELLITAAVFTVIGLAYWFDLGLCKIMNKPTPHPGEHSCNMGRTDEEVKELTKEDK